MTVSPGSQSLGTGLDCFHHDIYSHLREQTGNELKLQSLNPTQHWSHWRLWGHPALVWGSQEVNMPQPAQGPNSLEANLPQPTWGFVFQEAVMPQLA